MKETHIYMSKNSLFEYLGKPAGLEVGKQVYAAAKAKGIKPDTREVKNPKYTGKVLVYPVEFLDEYFKPKSSHPDDRDLPF